MICIYYSFFQVVAAIIVDSTMLKFVLTLILKLIKDKTLFCAHIVRVYFQANTTSETINKFEWIYSACVQRPREIRMNEKAQKKKTNKSPNKCENRHFIPLLENNKFGFLLLLMNSNLNSNTTINLRLCSFLFATE